MRKVSLGIICGQCEVRLNLIGGWREVLSLGLATRQHQHSPSPKFPQTVQYFNVSDYTRFTATKDIMKQSALNVTQ